MSSKTNSTLCLLCKIHPKGEDKTDRVLELLKRIIPYYRTSEAQCTTWCYLTPSKRKGALGQKATQAPIIGGIELYTQKEALSTQLADKQYFQWFHETVKKEDLYAKAEDLVAWYPTAGFLTKESKTVEHEDGMVVILAEVRCKDEKARNAALAIARESAAWIQDNEPGTLTYSLMIRPKAPNELLVFERYRNTRAMLQHMSSRKIQKDLASIGRYASSTSISEWTEVEGSFVGPAQSNADTAGAKL